MVVTKGVPAQICENCGEYYLSDEITNQVLKQAELSAPHNAEQFQGFLPRFIRH